MKMSEIKDIIAFAKEFYRDHDEHLMQVVGFLNNYQSVMIGLAEAKEDHEGHPAYCEPKVGIGVFVWREGKILLSKRKGSHGEGEWSLPGGHLEPGEDIRDCCIREVKEETGINIEHSLIEFHGLTNDLFPEEGLHYITLFYSVEIDAGIEAKLMEPDKCEGWDWFTKNKTPKPLFRPLEHMLKSR